MAITDLTGTTWYVPSGWLCSADFGRFNINGSYSAIKSDGTTTTGDITGFYLGKTSTSYTENWVHIYTGTYGANWNNTSSLQFTITDGVDVTNADLISWLETNGTMLKVTDLTNTTWTVKAGWEAEADFGIFSVKGTLTTTTKTYGFSQLGIGYYIAKGNSFNPYANGISTGSSWFSDNYALYLTFTGGTDTTNPKLIAWLTTYGVKMITDLTGYTVTVPSGWTAEGGFGEFHLLGRLIVNTYDREFNTTISPNLYIGYMLSNPASKYITYYSTTQSTSGYSFYFNGLPFVLIITGGSDASKPELIQWLYDNNATFEKTGGEVEPDTPEQPTTPHGEIYYKGNLVATIVEGETIVLHTKDFKFLGDIVIKNVGEAEETPTLISFTIDGTTYQAVEGMTWAEWCDSEYSTDNFSIASEANSAGGYNVYKGDNYYVRRKTDSADYPIYSVTTIIENGEYYLAVRS